MVKNLITKYEFSKLAGVSPAAITKALERDLKHALVGKKINPEHPEATKYIEKHVKKLEVPPATGIDPLYETAVAACKLAGTFSSEYLRKALGTGARRTKRIIDQMKVAGIKFDEAYIPLNKVSPDDTAEIIPEINSNEIHNFGELTLNEVVERFGTSSQFLDWLKATKEIEIIIEKRTKNEIAQGKLISKSLVDRFLIGPVETAHIKLLSDGVKTISARIENLVKAKKDLSDIEAYLADQIKSFIKPVKNSMIAFRDD